MAIRTAPRTPAARKSDSRTRTRWHQRSPRAHASRASLAHKAVQRDLALDILDGHLTALTGEQWTREDLSALWSVGHSEALNVDLGMALLERWDRFWKAAPGLASEDRAELTRLSAYRRWKHLRANARRQPRAALLNLVKCGFTSPRSLLHGLQPV